MDKKTLEDNEEFSAEYELFDAFDLIPELAYSLEAAGMGSASYWLRERMRQGDN